MGEDGRGIGLIETTNRLIAMLSTHGLRPTKIQFAHDGVLQTIEVAPSGTPEPKDELARARDRRDEMMRRFRGASGGILPDGDEAV